jgi:hypothetical protein
LPDHWKEAVIVPIYKKSDEIDSNNYRGISLLSISYKILSNMLFSQGEIHISIKLLEITIMSFNETDELLIKTFLHLLYTGGKMGVQ